MLSDGINSRYVSSDIFRNDDSILFLHRGFKIRANWFRFKSDFYFFHDVKVQSFNTLKPCPAASVALLARQLS